MDIETKAAIEKMGSRLKRVIEVENERLKEVQNKINTILLKLTNGRV